MSISRIKSIIFLLVLSFAGLIHAVDAPPTLADAQAAFAAGQFRPSLEKIAAALNSPEGRSGSQTRYDLFMLRGENLVQLKQPSLAIDAFTAAANASKSDADVTRYAVARANALIIQRSTGLQFRPTQGEPINIIPPDGRKLAMKALFDQLLASTTPRVNQALQGTSLEPIHELLPILTQMYALEEAATGKTEQTMAIGKEMGEHARGLITSEVNRLSQDIDDLTAIANQPSISNNGILGGGDTMGRMGLTSIQQNQIRNDGQYLQKIIQVSQEGRRINRRFGGTGQAWDAIIAEASDALQRAETTFQNR